MTPHPRSLVAVIALFSILACAGPGRPVAPSTQAPANASSIRERAVETAASTIGTPYRYGGSSPNGFDCSGLVVYSFAAAGLRGLPHSARALESRAAPIALSALRPGDLLFFDLQGRKTAHVAIYVGNHAFVHAPSAGKHVERVSLDHVYWGAQRPRAGRILP